MPFSVRLMEYERGWGARLDEVVYFNEVHHADEFVKNFNSENTDAVAPDWYMQAESPNFVRNIPHGKTARDEGLLL